MKVGELVAMGGVVPPLLEAPLTDDKLQEVRALYEQVYAVGLEAFFETKWYTTSQGLAALASNVGINEMVAGFLQSMAKTNANDMTGMQYSANLEFRVCWDLASLVNTCEAKFNSGELLPAPDDGPEARNRVAVFEALLSGDFLDQNPLVPMPSPQGGGYDQGQVYAQGDYHRVREFRFWYYLAEFLCVKDPDSGHGQTNPTSTARREEILGLLRELLDGRENRDVLYSFAVIRTLSPRFPSDFESTLPPHLDESDPQSKLAVARKFIQDEAQVTGGTTNVVRRFSELAVRAFILPGGNAPKRMR